jgi:diguanylate cyclase (GGDEF)-like protein
MVDGSHEQLELVLKLGTEINAESDLSVTLSTVCEAARVFGWENALVVLWREQPGDAPEAVLAAAAGFSSEVRAKLAARPIGPADLTSFGEHRISRSHLLGRTMDGSSPVSVRASGWEPERGVLVPVESAGERLGALVVDRPLDESGTSLGKIRILEHLADYAAVAIRWAHVTELIRTQSIADPLTGLANRRGFEVALRREVERAYRVEFPLSVLAVDLDRLGRINEAHGTEAGEEAIRAAAEVFREMLRQVDVAAHIGGGGFVVLLPGASSERARDVAERLRCGVAAANVPSVGAITATFGVAALSEHAANGAGLVQAASAALSTGKRRGRNRVAMAIPIGRGRVEGGADRRREDGA